MTKVHKMPEPLKKALADTYTLYLKTQNYHWNVLGTHFHQLHLLFEGQYKEMQEAIDEMAERIRAFGVKIPASFKIFLSLTTLKEGKETIPALEMVKELYEDQHQLVKTLHEALKSSEEHNDPATGDMMIQRIKVHEKNAWMLASALGEESNVEDAS